jgi:hypothetical protein
MYANESIIIKFIIILSKILRDRVLKHALSTSMVSPAACNRRGGERH